MEVEPWRPWTAAGFGEATGLVVFCGRGMSGVSMDLECVRVPGLFLVVACT